MSKVSDPEFVKVYRFVTDVVGTNSSAVYGAVWYFEGKTDGYCHASLETLGLATGLSKSTVHRCLWKLMDYGFIERISEPADHTPPGYVTLRGPEHPVYDERVVTAGSATSQSGIRELSQRD